jgi:hypothetical protein
MGFKPTVEAEPSPEFKSAAKRIKDIEFTPAPKKVKESMPVSNGPIAMQPDAEPTRVKQDSLYEFMRTTSRQLAELTALVRALAPRADPTPVFIDDTHPPTHLGFKDVKTQNGGFPILKNGMVSTVIRDIPSLEQVLAGAKAYRSAHGPEALLQAVKSVSATASKISELDEVQRATFLERISDEKPEELTEDE